MTRWIPCGEGFIVGDVVRWKEPVWAEKGKRKKRLVKVGERRVTGEVTLAETRGFVVVSILKCEILASPTQRALAPYRKGDSIRRKRSTIGRGSGERLEWSEEGARALAVSKFA
jgi:hypothetical protein